MKVKVAVNVTAHDALLMHKNDPEMFSVYVYTLMDHYGCSRTPDEILSISTYELMKDMWYLRMYSNSCVNTIAEIDVAVLNNMLSVIEGNGIVNLSLDTLFHEYVEAMINNGVWENV